MSENKAGNGNSEVNPEVRFKLRERILGLSVANTWDEAALEWKFSGYDYDDDGQECLCGHPDIKHLHYVENTVNGNNAILGCKCITRVGQPLPAAISNSILRVEKDAKKAFRPEVIEMAFKKGWIDSRSRAFYIETWRRHSGLSPKQMVWRVALNAKILQLLGRSKMEKAA